MTAVRPFRPDDAPALAALYRRSVEVVGARFYSPAQVAAWAGGGPTAEHLAALYGDGRVALVAVDAADRPLAFGDVEADGHVQFLYCAPEAVGTGVAAALWEALEAAARSRGIGRLYAEASEAARPFLERRGFAVLAVRRFAVAGVPIHNYAVEKVLAAAPPRRQ